MNLAVRLSFVDQHHPTCTRRHIRHVLPLLGLNYAVQPTNLESCIIESKLEIQVIALSFVMLIQYASIFIYLFTEDLVAVLNRSEDLLTGLRVGSTEDQLGIQLP